MTLIDAVIKLVSALREDNRREAAQAKAGKDTLYLGKVEMCDEILRALNELKRRIG